MNIETRLAQVGNRKEPLTGAVSFPVYHSTTFAHPGLGESTGFDYTRTQNPTRNVLEETIAQLEGGVRGFAFSSGMAAVHTVFGLLRQGEHVVVSNDLYGGTYRLLEQVLRDQGVLVSYVDTSDLEAVRAALKPETRMVFVETPTNPMMKVTDLHGCTRIAREHELILVVDNTFMTPYFQRPLELGADIVLHSGTKYLGGHNDLLAGLVVAREEVLAQRIGFLQNTVGAVLGPQDCWLLMRGMKTLALRMEKHDQNARIVANWLAGHPQVTRVYYPGLAESSQRQVLEAQASGYGGMISFEVSDENLVPQFLSSVRLVTFAESLGGTETLVTYPARQTHADIPEKVRDAVGVNNRLLRLSVGIEHVDDIITDLASALG